MNYNEFRRVLLDIPHMGMQVGQSAQTPDQTNKWEKILSFFFLND